MSIVNTIEFKSFDFCVICVYVVNLHLFRNNRLAIAPGNRTIIQRLAMTMPARTPKPAITTRLPIETGPVTDLRIPSSRPG